MITFGLCNKAYLVKSLIDSAVAKLHKSCSMPFDIPALGDDFDKHFSAIVTNFPTFTPRILSF